MNGEERQLITGLFDRMRGVGAVEKDRDAEALISQSVRQIPDAPYMLVQSVLVQENALQQAGQRIEDLEARVRELEQQSYRQQPAQTSGGFLGGLFGGSQPVRPAPQPMARGSVPSVGGGRPMGAPAGGAWGNAPGYGQPGQPGYAQPPQQAAGGGFMKSAMATAAGVAGGMLVAGAISNMMKGDQANASGAQPQSAAQDTSNDPGYDYNDPGMQQAADDGNDPGWDGGDAGDMDI
jgi:hypothetical protein